VSSLSPYHQQKRKWLRQSLFANAFPNNNLDTTPATEEEVSIYDVASAGVASTSSVLNSVM
jgi:hypothetical protein